MKMKSVCLLLLAMVVGFSLIGCSCARQAAKGEVAPAAAPEEKKIAAPEEKKEVATTTQAPTAATPTGPAASVPAVTMNAIYFDFDKYTVRAGDAEILKGNMAWFKANPTKKVRIEGNCDERGTVEYNLALGQKRADSAKSYLITLGVDGALMETVSYGKEKPVDPGHNEAAWAKNRRADFVALP